ncbi:MAG TPA: DUF6789 family protein [Herpetosiphonaceae bacterium]
MTMYVTKVRGLSPQDGAAGGAIAGLAQTAVAMIYGLLNGRSLLSFPNLLGTLAGQPDTFNGFGLQTLLGIIVNVLILAGLGALFAVIARTFEGKQLVYSALAFGLVAWAVGYFLILPFWSPELRNDAGPLTTASSMLVYGSVLGTYLSRRQKRELVSHS